MLLAALTPGTFIFSTTSNDDTPGSDFDGVDVGDIFFWETCYSLEILGQIWQKKMEWIQFATQDDGHRFF